MTSLPNIPRINSRACQSPANFRPFLSKALIFSFKARDDQGRFVGPFGIIVQTPDLAKAYMAMSGAVARIGGLDPDARETAILVVGAGTEAKYET